MANGMGVGPLQAEMSALTAIFGPLTQRGIPAAVIIVPFDAVGVDERRRPRELIGCARHTHNFIGHNYIGYNYIDTGGHENLSAVPDTPSPHRLPPTQSTTKSKIDAKTDCVLLCMEETVRRNHPAMWPRGDERAVGRTQAYAPRVHLGPSSLGRLCRLFVTRFGSSICVFVNRTGGVG